MTGTVQVSLGTAPIILLQVLEFYWEWMLLFPLDVSSITCLKLK